MCTLQGLHHHMHTAFGDSDNSCTGDPEFPLQGLVQGHGPAPQGWTAVSLPIIKMMKESGCGFQDLLLISIAMLYLVCFSFVDDTDLVNMLPDGNYDADSLIARTQAGLEH